jgi:hypothetical protein
MELVKAIPTVGNAVDIEVSTDRIYVAEDLAGVSIINRHSYQRFWYNFVTSSEGDTVNLTNINHIGVVESEKKMFINEVKGADQIEVIDIDSLLAGVNNPPLRIINTILGGTGHIMDIHFYPSNDPLDTNSLYGYFVNDNYYRFGNFIRASNTWEQFIIDKTIPSMLSGVALTDQNVFLAALQQGLIILDRQTAAIVNNFDLPGAAAKITISGNYAFVACKQAGLQIVDISNPLAPTLVGSFPTSSFATTVDVEGKYCMIGTGSGGVYLFNVSNPAKARLLEHNTDTGYVYDVKINNQQAIIGTRDKGVLIYNLP